MKTVKEFDYDLWAIEENGVKRYFLRVKETGEESEISHDIMKVMLSEEKRIRREMHKKIENGILSLDCLASLGDSIEPSWLIDEKQDVEESVCHSSIEIQFLSLLTDKQKDFYLNCMKQSLSLRKYAALKGIGLSTAQDLQEAVRKKYKKYFF